MKDNMMCYLLFAGTVLVLSSLLINPNIFADKGWSNSSVSEDLNYTQFKILKVAVINGIIEKIDQLNDTDVVGDSKLVIPALKKELDPLKQDILDDLYLSQYNDLQDFKTFANSSLSSSGQQKIIPLINYQIDKIVADSAPISPSTPSPPQPVIPSQWLFVFLLLLIPIGGLAVTIIYIRPKSVGDSPANIKIESPPSGGNEVIITVRPTGSGPNPTGKVTVSVGGRHIGTHKLKDGVAKIPIIRPPGTHQISASYLGDKIYKYGKIENVNIFIGEPVGTQGK